MTQAPAELPEVLPGASVRGMDVAAGASWLAAQGARIASRNGVLWALRPGHLGGSPGFWTPVAELAPLPIDSVGFLNRRALGFRVVVAEPSAATGSYPIWRVADLPAFGSARVAKGRRNEVRRAVRRVELQVLTDPEPLVARGWPVAVAAARRSGQSLAPDEATFRRRLGVRFAADPQAVVAASLDGRLVAFALSHAIAATAYLTHVYIDPGARASEVGSGLYWAVLSLWQRTPGVSELSLGADLPHLTGLRSFKRSFGAELARLPVVAKFRRPVAAFLRVRSPETLRRSGSVAGEHDVIPWAGAAPRRGPRGATSAP